MTLFPPNHPVVYGFLFIPKSSYNLSNLIPPSISLLKQLCESPHPSFLFYDLFNEDIDLENISPVDIAGNLYYNDILINTNISYN